MLQLEVFIGELLAIDRFSSSAVTLREVTTLNHEIFNDSVEG